MTIVSMLVALRSLQEACATEQIPGVTAGLTEAGRLGTSGELRALRKREVEGGGGGSGSPSRSWAGGVRSRRLKTHLGGADATDSFTWFCWTVPCEPRQGSGPLSLFSYLQLMIRPTVP